MTSSVQTSSTALVTGASRGFGRAIAAALHGEGATVVAVARNAELLASLRHELGGTLTTEASQPRDRISRATSRSRVGDAVEAPADRMDRARSPSCRRRCR